MTEKGWVMLASRSWDTIRHWPYYMENYYYCITLRNCPYYMEYSRLLP